jgi:hypothetical protein
MTLPRPEVSAIGRPPNAAAMAFDSYKRELLAFRELGAQLLRTTDKLLAAEARLLAEANVAVSQEGLERELQTVLAMRRGTPFWDRPEPEPHR